MADPKSNDAAGGGPMRRRKSLWEAPRVIDAALAIKDTSKVLRADETTSNTNHFIEGPS